MKHSLKVNTIKTSKLLRKTVLTAWKEEVKQQSYCKSHASVVTNRPLNGKYLENETPKPGGRSHGSVSFQPIFAR